MPSFNNTSHRTFLFQIYKSYAQFLVLLQMFRYHCMQGKDMVNCRTLFSKACLCLRQNMVIFCLLRQTWIHDWSIKFTNTAQERTAPAVIRIGCVAFFVDWLNNSLCPLWSFRTRFKVFIEEARHTIIWTCQDYPTGNSSRRETKRQTEETMGRLASKSGLALGGIYYYGQLKTARSGGSWL